MSKADQVVQNELFYPSDQSFACGPQPMLAALARLAEGRRERLGVAKLGRKKGGGKVVRQGSAAGRRRSFLQVSMEQNMGCAVGACLGCVVKGAGHSDQQPNYLCTCKEGPVFRADQLDWGRAVAAAATPQGGCCQ